MALGRVWDGGDEVPKCRPNDDVVSWHGENFHLELFACGQEHT